MSNVTEFVSQDDIQTQACAWISKIDRGLDADERRDLSSWCQRSERHQRSLFEMAELWDDMSALNELKGLFPLSSQSPRRRTFNAGTRWSIAATLTFAIFAGMLGIAVNVIDSQPATAIAKTDNIAETMIGEQRPVTLTDGSVIHLNTDTRVRVNFTNAVREIELVRGEAHFDVAHNPERPFVVRAGENTVTAVGTAFNVERVSSHDFDVLVTEGKVLVEAAGEQLNADINAGDATTPQSRYLEAGEKLAYRGSDAIASTLSLDQVQRDLAWQQGMLVFQGESLASALSEVSRYTSVRFEVPEGDIHETRVAGYFKAGDIDGLLFALKNNFDIGHERLADDRIRLLAIRVSEAAADTE